tara:strand:- start:1001 stop:1600 length:600 start_codon:yes stop_codon:yes gene_type:complete
MSTYKVKVISLERRQDRRRKMVNMFQHIPFEFVNALDGQEYKLTAYDKKMIKGNEYEKYGIHIPSLVCANYMHLNLLDECSKQDLPYFIFEDDVELTENKAPENYFETLASVVDLDAFWLIAGTPTIAAYVVWPLGAKIMKNYIIRKAKLKVGLDWSFWDLRNSGKLRVDQAKESYFATIPGKDSDITNLENYDISSDK